MSLAIDIVLVLIVVFLAWRGYTNGFLRAILGLLAIIAAIYGANLVAKTYSDNFTDMLEPFVGGIVDNAVTETVLGGYEADSGGTQGADDTGTAAENTGMSKVYEVSFKAMRLIGVSEEASGLLAGKVDTEITTVGQQMTHSLTEKLSQTLAYILVFALTFILILILFAIIGNLLNMIRVLPGIETADRLIGLALGLLKGALLVLAIAVIIRYLGLLSPETIGKTVILKYITDANPLADILGI